MLKIPVFISFTQPDEGHKEVESTLLCINSARQGFLIQPEKAAKKTNPICIGSTWRTFQRPTWQRPQRSGDYVNMNRFCLESPPQNNLKGPQWGKTSVNMPGFCLADLPKDNLTMLQLSRNYVNRKRFCLTNLPKDNLTKAPTEWELRKYALTLLGRKTTLRRPQRSGNCRPSHRQGDERPKEAGTA